MDEMDMLKNVLPQPGPSDDAVSNRRLELEQLIDRQSRARRRRPGWRVAGIGLTAAAAAGAVTAALLITPRSAGTAGLITPGSPHTRTGTSSPTAAGRHPAPAKQPASRILLAAAVSAARTPSGSGIYWYVRIRAAFNDGHTLQLLESWTTRDGRTWVRDEKTGSAPVEIPQSPGMLGPFFLGGQELTFSQIQDLPTDPAALTRWIAANAGTHGGKSGGPAPSTAQEREDIFDSLTSLISELPAPPKVRAAAFRALAVLPGVASLGQIGGGQGIRFTLPGGEQATLIVDPSTGQIIATNFFVDNQGAEYFQDVPNATITGRWTDTLP